MSMRIKVVGALLAVSALLVGAMPSSASASSIDRERAFEKALHAVASGQATTADRTLVRSQPQVAAQVIDPQAAQHGVTAGRVASSATSRATSCTWADVWYRARTLLGFTAYIWHHYVRWCHNGSTVTSWSTRYDYSTHVSSQHYVRELTVNTKGVTGHSTSFSHMQRRIENCVIKYGCIGSYYPWSKITVTRTGSYSYTGSAD